MTNRHTHWLLVLIVLLGGQSLSASAQTLTPQARNGSYTGIEPLSPMQEFAMQVKAENQNRKYPQTVYWGIGEIEWGMAEDKASTKSVKRQKGKTKLVSEDGMVNAVEFHFAEDIADRNERLSEYRRIKAELVAEYGVPSHGYHPEAQHGSGDAYVQGINPYYHIEWHGGQTVVSLKLSDDDLVLEFRQSSASRAKDLSLAAATAEEIRNSNQ